MYLHMIHYNQVSLNRIHCNLFIKCPLQLYGAQEGTFIQKYRNTFKMKHLGKLETHLPTNLSLNHMRYTELQHFSCSWFLATT